MQLLVFNFSLGCNAEAVPKKILELMNVEKLNRENVASHLQALILNFTAIVWSKTYQEANYLIFLAAEI